MAQRFEYQVIQLMQPLEPAKIQGVLADLGKDGWRLVGTPSTSMGAGGDQLFLIVERPESGP